MEKRVLDFPHPLLKFAIFQNSRALEVPSGKVTNYLTAIVNQGMWKEASHIRGKIFTLWARGDLLGERESCVWCIRLCVQTREAGAPFEIVI